MNFQNIEYFLSVVEHKSFTKAAQSLYISQQSLSENVKRLEDEIGVPLLIRDKTLTLTPAGECFASGGRKILSTQDKMLREIAIISNTCRRKIILSILPSDIPPFLPHTLSIFSKNYPEYEVEISNPSFTEIPDLTFSLTPSVKGYESISLIENDPCMIVFSKLLATQIFGNDWENSTIFQEPSISLSQIKKMPILLLFQNRHLFPYFQELFLKEDFQPIECFKSEDANLLTSLCINNVGAFIGPADYCKRKFGPLLDPQTGNLCSFLIKNANTFHLSLIYPKGKHLNQAEKRFIDTLRLSITG